MYLYIYIYVYVYKLIRTYPIIFDFFLRPTLKHRTLCSNIPLNNLVVLLVAVIKKKKIAKYERYKNTQVIIMSI